MSLWNPVLSLQAHVALPSQRVQSSAAMVHPSPWGSRNAVSAGSCRSSWEYRWHMPSLLVVAVMEAWGRVPGVRLEPGAPSGEVAEGGWHGLGIHSRHSTHWGGMIGCPGLGRVYKFIPQGLFNLQTAPLILNSPLMSLALPCPVNSLCGLATPQQLCVLENTL